MAMSKSYQVTLKKQLDTVSMRTNISYPLKSYLNIVRLILDSLGFRHQSFMKDNRRRKTPEFEFSSVFPTSYTRYRFFCLIIKQIDATGSGVGKFHPAPNSREYLFFSLNYLSKGLKELSSRQKLRERLCQNVGTTFFYNL